MTKAVVDTEAVAGCNDCKGAAVIWAGKNALLMAGAHHKNTGHQTWAEQTQRMTWGQSEVDKRQGTLL